MGQCRWYAQKGSLTTSFATSERIGELHHEHEACEDKLELDVVKLLVRNCSNLQMHVVKTYG